MFLPDSATNRGRESYLQHAFHDASRVVPDFVIGQGSRTNDALDATCAAFGVATVHETALGSVVDVMLVCLHAFLVSYASSSSAHICNVLITSSS
jgi:hypothetical protein